MNRRTTSPAARRDGGPLCGLRVLGATGACRSKRLTGERRGRRLRPRPRPVFEKTSLRTNDAAEPRFEVDGKEPERVESRSRAVLGRLFLFCLVLLFVDLFLLMWLAEHTSAVFAFALVVVTGVLGVTLAARQKVKVRKRNAELSEAGRLTPVELAESVVIPVAGVLLLLPGPLTDVLGFALLVPPLRRLLCARLLEWLSGRFERFLERVTTPSGSSASGEVVSHGEVIEAEFYRHEFGPDEPPPLSDDQAE